MSVVINDHAAGRVYIKCRKSTVTKLPHVRVPKGGFTITAVSRGKELMMSLKPCGSLAETASSVFILCNMGMTGFFGVAPSVKEQHKHAHLSFHASDGSILSFVDVRRFGTWRCLSSPEWPVDRGPDPVKEHDSFRRGVIAAVASNPDRFRDKPICQVMHDQKIFNGIGNYLRAEILFRAGVPPFAPAEEVLAGMKICQVMQDSNQTDLLTLCSLVPKEVIDMNLSKYQGGQARAATETDAEHGKWQQWLRVYSHKDASWAVDQEGRRIWFRGPPGKLFAQFAQQSSLPQHRLGSSLKKRPAAETRIMKKPAASRIMKKPAARLVSKKLHVFKQILKRGRT
jgi:endonuclease VIII-like 1